MNKSVLLAAFVVLFAVSGKAQAQFPPADITPYLPRNNVTPVISVTRSNLLAANYDSYAVTYPALGGAVRATTISLPKGTPPNVVAAVARALAANQTAYQKFTLKYGTRFTQTIWFKVNIDPLYFKGVWPGYVPPRGF